MDEFDLGYRFFKKHWGKGYATESAKACINYGFSKLQIREIVGRSYVENKASIRVLKKCNLKFKKQFVYSNQQAVLYTIKNDSN